MKRVTLAMFLLCLCASYDAQAVESTAGRGMLITNATLRGLHPMINVRAHNILLMNPVFDQDGELVRSDFTGSTYFDVAFNTGEFISPAIGAGYNYGMGELILSALVLAGTENETYGFWMDLWMDYQPQSAWGYWYFGTFVEFATTPGALKWLIIGGEYEAWGKWAQDSDEAPTMNIGGGPFVGIRFHECVQAEFAYHFRRWPNPKWTPQNPGMDLDENITGQVLIRFKMNFNYGIKAPEKKSPKRKAPPRTTGAF